VKLEDEILINQYGQHLIESDVIVENFIKFSVIQKREYLTDLAALIIQSKPNNSDIEDSIRISGLKATSTPCIVLRKGVANHILIRIIALSEIELIKALKLFLSIFRIAYYRRFEKERDNPNKCWYWDLSKSENIDLISNI